MAEIITFIQSNWLQWLFAALMGALAWGYKNISHRLAAEQAKNEAIAEGVQSLLRESIVNNYNHYSEKGYCPIYAKENIEAIYGAYSRLGGNHTAKKLYETLMTFPEDKPDA